MVGLARYLAGLNLVTYSATGSVLGTGTPCFLNHLPDTTTDIAVRLWEYSGLAPDGQLGYDPQFVQVYVRGVDDNYVPVRAKAYALYNATHGLGSILLPDGTYLVNCLAQQPPCALGVDERNRFCYSFNLYCEVRNVTTHRE